MKAVSLFAGVGGFDIAAQTAGIDMLATAEVDKHANAVLRRQFPEVHHYDDVRKVNRDGLLRDTGALPDLIIGGFPCQDVSVAGRQAGLAGARSSLFYEGLRVAEECRAAWVVLENVPGLLSSNRGRDMGAVLGALADCGYGVAYRVLDAQYFGVPQRRRRVFVVGRLGDDGSAPGEVLALTEGSLGHPAPSRPSRSAAARAAGVGAAGVGGATRDVAQALTSCGRFGVDDNTAQAGHLIVQAVGGDIAHTLTAEGADASEGGNNSASGAYEYDMTPTLPASQTIAVQSGTVVRRLTPTECERLQGFPDGWTAGQADSHRYKQMGNAVAVPCVTWLLRRLVAVDAAREVAA